MGVRSGWRHQGTRLLAATETGSGSTCFWAHQGTRPLALQRSRGRQGTRLRERQGTRLLALQRSRERQGTRHLAVRSPRRRSVLGRFRPSGAAGGARVLLPARGQQRHQGTELLTLNAWRARPFTPWESPRETPKVEPCAHAPFREKRSKNQFVSGFFSGSILGP